MSKVALKADLIKRIANLKDAYIIEGIQRMLDFELDEKVYQFSEEQLRRIEEGRKEFSDGEVLSEKQANVEIEKWLDEK